MKYECDEHKREAVEKFIDREFNSIPQSMVFAYIDQNHDGYLEDITEFHVNEAVVCDDDCYGQIVSINDSGTDTTFDIRIDGEDRIESYPADEVYHKGWQGERGFPMWGTMWALNRNHWIEHTQELSDCGFAVFDCEDEDLLFVGIDGAGYSFFDEHFVPLYDRMGLEWHLHLDSEVSRIANRAIVMASEFGLKPDEIAKKLDLPLDIVKDRLPKPKAKTVR